MDLGSKTLSQLSEEGKEKMFVTLEVGSKISGYTKEYLERLCRLQKVEYRMRGDIYVIELTSLLDATHTILLSYEDITFVDKNELSDPPPQASAEPVSSALKTITPETSSVNSEASRLFTAKVAEGITQDIPRFSDSNRPDDSASTAFSFVGRAVVSDGTTAVENPGNDAHTPVSVLSSTPARATPPPAPQSVTPDATPAPVTLRSAPLQPVVSAKVVPAIAHAPIHIPIGGEKSSVLTSSPEDTKLPEVHTPVHLQVMREKDEPKVSVPDEWDKALLGAEIVTPEPVSLPAQAPVTAGLTPSQYRPITTSLDASAHHDPAPLFPTVGTPVTIPERIKPQEHPSIPALGEDQKVIVFDPQEFSGARMTAPIAATPSVAPVLPATAQTTSVSTVATATPVAPTSARPPVPMRPSVPQIRVMPQVATASSALPMLSEEHQMILREQHPLTKSTAFNVAFAVLFLGFSVSILGGLLRGGELARMAGGSVNYVAGVGAVGATIPTPAVDADIQPVPETKGVLPFSDEITVTEGESPNSIVVQPVFKDGVGGYYEYTIVGTSSEITRVVE